MYSAARTYSYDTKQVAKFEIEQLVSNEIDYLFRITKSINSDYF